LDTPEEPLVDEVALAGCPVTRPGEDPVGAAKASVTENDTG
jgi:hypothetical protein